MHSGKIIEAFVAQSISPEAARKRLQRARPPVRWLPDLRLPDGGRFWYLQDHQDKEVYWQKLIEALDETNSAYGIALHSLAARGGLVPAMSFATISGSPLRRRGHLPPEAILDTLTRIGLIETLDEPDLGFCVRLTSQAPFAASSSSERKAILVAEKILLNALKDWARKLGLVSYDSVRIRSDPRSPDFGHYGWDFTAPSYTFPLKHFNEKRELVAGHVVADVALGRTLTLPHVKYFLRKCSSLRSRPATSSFLGLLVADRFEADAFDLGKKNGLLFTTVENLFGSHVQKVLHELIRTLSDTAASIRTEPSRIKDLFERLAVFEGAVQQIRGPLFELMVAYCLQQTEPGPIEYNAVVRDPDSGQKVNIDILQTGPPKHLWAYECKGHRSDKEVTREEVEDWVFRQIPRIVGYARSHPDHRNRDLHFEFWTTGKFSEDALLFLEEREAKRYTLAWKDGTALRDYLEQNKLFNILDILRQFYGPLIR